VVLRITAPSPSRKSIARTKIIVPNNVRLARGSNSGFRVTSQQTQHPAHGSLCNDAFTYPACPMRT
jgi:hypothetical protein